MTFYKGEIEIIKPLRKNKKYLQEKKNKILPQVSGEKNTVS